MKKTDKATTRAYGHIQAKVEQIPETLERLREAAALLVVHGWFEQNNIERFSRYESFDMVRDAIGEAAERWGIPATERVVRALEARNVWFATCWDHNVPALLERWKERQSSEY